MELADCRRLIKLNQILHLNVRPGPSLRFQLSFQMGVLSPKQNTRVAHSECLIDVVLKFRMRQLDMSGYYLRYLSKLNSKT